MIFDDQSKSDYHFSKCQFNLGLFMTAPWGEAKVTT